MTARMRPDASLFKDAWLLLTVRQRIGAAACLAFFVFASVLELAGLSSTMPFVTALINPAQANESPIIQTVSALLGHPPFDQLLLWLAGGVAFLVLAGSVAGLAATTLIEWFGVRVTAYFAERMIRETLAAPYQWFLDKQAPILAQRFIQDPMTAGLALYPPMMEIIYNALFLLFALMTILLVLPVQSVFVMGALFVAAAGLLVAFRPMTEHFASAQRDLMMQGNKIGVEAINGIKDVKVKGRENYFVRVHNATVYAAAITRMKLNLINRTVPALVLLVGQLGMLAVALVLFLTGARGATLTAQLTLLVLVVGRTLPAATRLFGNVNKLSSSKPFVRALIAIREDIVETNGTAAQSQLPDVPAHWREVVFADVSYRYPKSDRPALTGVSLALIHNCFYGIVGPSGAGKTTFVDVLLGLLEPQMGQILVDGRPLGEYSRRSWFSNIGYVPQNPFVTNDTVRRNVAFGLYDQRIEDDRVWYALERAGLADVCRALPECLDTPMGDRGTRLSGGQRQRLAIARALYDEPKLLILDEATSALDTPTEREIQSMIAELVGKVTVIAIAHRFSTIELCDRLYVLEDGSLVAQGTYGELLGISPLFRALTSHLLATPNSAPLASVGGGR